MNKLLVKIILILVMLSYIFFLMNNASKLSCDQCTVTFKGKLGYTFNYTMSELFNKTKEERCPIYWDRVSGYVQT